MFPLFQFGHRGKSPAKMEQWEKITFGVFGFFIMFPVAFLLGSFSWNIITTWMDSPPDLWVFIFIGPFLILMIFLSVSFFLAGVDWVILFVKAIKDSVRNRVVKNSDQKNPSAADEKGEKSVMV